MCSWHWGPGRGGGMRTDLAGDPTGGSGVQTEEEAAVPVAIHRAASPKQAAHTWGLGLQLSHSCHLLGHLLPEEQQANRTVRLWEQTASQRTTATKHDDCAIVTDEEG